MNAMRREGLSGLWAIRKDDIREIAHNMKALAARAVHTDDLHLKAEAHFQAQMDDPRVTLVGSVAVIPICGPIFNRGNLYSYFFGGAVICVLRAQLQKALADDSVRAILLRVDSPGGVTDGVTEFAADLLRARAIKPITAIADTCMASAAYWLAASAQEVIATPSAVVGSIGVYYEHEVIAKALEIAGVEIELVASSEEKVELHESKTMSDAAREHQQEMVDAVSAMFFGDIAKGRGVTPKVVATDYGKGRVFLAADAKRMGMVDRVATFEDTVARLTGGGKRRSVAAAIEMPELQASADAEPPIAVPAEGPDASGAAEPALTGGEPARSADADRDWTRAVLSRVERQVNASALDA
jgi:signal peptide peptidase SppA